VRRAPADAGQQVGQEALHPLASGANASIAAAKSPAVQALS